MTDIEGSTRLLQELGDRYPKLLADHYRLLRVAFGSAGAEVSTEGDALFFVFDDARSAIRAALEGQRRLAAHAWPPHATVRVRMGIHSGEGRLLGTDYVGLDVHRTARITSAGHGGQIVVSDAARALAEAALPNGASLRDLGEHRLKDLERSEHLFQVVAPGLQAEFPPLRSLDARPHNLPAHVTSFVGRTREKDQLLELLGSSRLVTLTGPGGTGKTRLAVEAASACVDDFADGVFFVPLAMISEADLVVPTIAATLGIREGPARPIRAALMEHLAGRSVLLLLDNFEQVIDAAPTVGELLAAAPRVKVFVTSREPLRIAGEQDFPVPPLALPDDHARSRTDELRAVDSVSLFVERARSIRPGFDLTPDNAAAVAGICTRLDGLPLALELAAARTRLFEPRELLARLDRCLSFLIGGRDLSARQRTLRGTIDWSYELLGESEQVLLRRLSVFAGGCTLDAVEAVCDPEELEIDAVEGLASLHDKSLLRRVDAGELRMTMLETIREYARDRLEGSGEASEIRARHAAFFLDLAEQAAGHLQGPEQQRWLDMLDRELDNFRAVIRAAIESGETETGLRLAAALTMFWLFRGHQKEGRRHLEEVLALPTSGEIQASRAAGLDAAVELMSWQGDYDAVRPLAEEALVIHRKLGNVAGVANQLSSLGYANIVPDPATARELFRESVEAYQQAGGPPMMGGALIGMGCAEMRLGNVDEGTKSLKEAEQLFRRAGDHEMLSIPIGLLGVAARLKGDLAAARRQYADVLVRSQEAGRHLGIAMALQCLADLALVEGQPEHAVVMGAAEARLAEQLGGTPSLELVGIPDVLERARAELGDERYEAAVARGRAAPLDEIADLALAEAAETKRTYLLSTES